MRTDMDVDDTSAASEPSRMEGNFKATVICWFLGLGCLLSWNSMLTIGDYYYALFPDYHFERVLTIVYEPFALGVLAILTCYEARINTSKRNLVGYVVFCTSTFGLILIDLASLGKGGIGSFIATCVMVAAFGVADAHCQGGMVGALSYMCPEFLQLFFAGLAGSGALTSVLRLISKAAFDKTENGLQKVLFLAISTFMELVCILLYGFIFPKIPIVKYYRRKAASEGSKTVTADLAAAGLHTNDDTITEDPNDRLSTKRLLLKNLDYLSGLFFTYAVTLSIIPGFLYENTGNHHLGSWYSVVLIATYNVWDLISRYIPLIDCLRLESRKGLMIATLLRFLVHSLLLLHGQVWRCRMDDNARIPSRPNQWISHDLCIRCSS